MTNAVRNEVAAPTASSREEDPLLQEFTYPSMFGPAEVFALETEDGTPVRVLYVGGGFQSATFLGERRFQPVFAYYRALDALFQADLNHERLLLIGGGGYSYPKHLLTTRDHTAIDVVEIDPAVIQIARDHFFLDEIEAQHGPAGTNRLRSFAQEGLTFLESAPNATYSAVINDSFDGTAPTAHLLSDHALEQAKRCLIPNGLYLLNLVVDEDPEDPQAQALAQRTLESVRSALTGAFSHVFEQLCVDEEIGGADNHLFVATDGPHSFEGFEPIS
ncbi:MAG: spermidine synthase [Eggerthellaceae bacterium]